MIFTTLLALLWLPVLFAEETAYWQLPVPAQGETPTGRLPPTDSIDAFACGLCHVQQLADWGRSLHRRAVSPGLVGQLAVFDVTTQGSCLDCHAPRLEQQSRWQEARLAAIDELHGVDCASCHLRKQVHYGPSGKEATPHGKTHRLGLFREAMFCATCHQFGEDGIQVNGTPLENTYVEWLASPYAKAGVTCQHCHMPAGRHLFRGIHDPETTRRGLTVFAMRHAAGVSIYAGNTGAGHALPTYITPRVTLRITGINTGRVAEKLLQRQMTWDSDTGWTELADTRLFPKEWTRLDLDLSSREKAMVEVLVEPDADYRERVYPALLSALSDELTPRQAALLRRAHDDAGRSGYVLYQMVCGVWKGIDTVCRMQTPSPWVKLQ